MPGKGTQVEAKATRASRAVLTESGVNTGAPQPKAKPPKAKAKPLPAPTWKKIRLNLSPDEAAARVQIREFILRFAPVMTTVISKAHLEELALIGGSRRSDLDEDEMTSWVSEACTKSVILALLGLLADDAEGDTAKVL